MTRHSLTVQESDIWSISHKDIHLQFSPKSVHCVVGTGGGLLGVWLLLVPELQVCVGINKAKIQTATQFCAAWPCCLIFKWPC